MSNYMELDGERLPVFNYGTIVVGTGAAGYCAADRLYSVGETNVAMVTEHVMAGTSRNTGSDKQTYYKLTLAGREPDSVGEMAETLYSGGCVDGDLALCEAALSVRCFMRLVELGVPFPKNRYGEYIGYKTDHDPRRRATSVGPYTSRQMTECLQRAVEDKGVPVFDKTQVIRILSNGKQVYGLLGIDVDTGEYRVFNCRNVVFATGGPAGIYADSAYPQGHFGATGLALEAGALGRNLTEWQYGLASLRPRWNVSGTYMQALPRFFSTDACGGNEREFLSDFFEDTAELLSLVFLKGYQWPFDVHKLRGGSSLIDLLVYQETKKGRRVFLDFRQNTGGRMIDYSALNPEARDYLKKAGASQPTPFARLANMNQPAVDFYLDRGVDLSREPLEITLCAQHNNGGLAVDHWWQTNLAGFFAVGEAAASHGVTRPGGSALNAGQVGATRCAEYIAANKKNDAPEQAPFELAVREQVDRMLALGRELVGEKDNAEEWMQRITRRMSQVGGPIRDVGGICAALIEIQQELRMFSGSVRVQGKKGLPSAFRLRETLICQYVYLSAMVDYIKKGGKSRGSALYSDPDELRFVPDDGELDVLVQELCYEQGGCRTSWRARRPIPQEDDFFENVWRDYRENGNIY